MTSIAIVEPNRLTRVGIQQAVARDGVVRVVASVTSPAELTGPPADVVVLSSRACPADLCATVAALRQSAGVLVLADEPAPAELLAALQAGAGGFVTPDAQDAELLAAIDAVAHGAFYLMAGLAPYLYRELPGRPDRSGAKDLAPREVETLRLIATGHTHRQIARRMGLTEATVNTYVKRIRAKLKAGNKAELTRKAIDLGYLAPEPAGTRMAGWRQVPLPSPLRALERSA
jgi:DNA-binding NarL/FixJ family response regulator